MGLRPYTPDDFLLAIYDLAPATITAAIDAQVAALTNPPIPRRMLLGMLETAGVPRFAQKLKDHDIEQASPTYP